MATPLVSAIVINLNGGDHLQESLESLCRQTWPQLEIILVDNGSTDGSIDRAREDFGDRVEILVNPRNLGFARANNQAITRSRGEWVFLLNNDARAAPDTVERLMAFAATRPETGLLACRVTSHDRPHVFDSAGLLLYPDGVCRPRGWEEVDMGQYDRPEEVLAPHGCAAALRRTMLDEVGLFDERYFAYLEDLDLGMRAQLQGWRCWYVPGARVVHRKSATFGNYSRFKAYYVERNRIFNAVKLLPRFILLVSPLFTLNRYLMQAYATATRKGISSDFVREYSYAGLALILLQAYGAALLQLPRLLRERRRLSRRRRISTEEWYRLISRFKLDAIELALKH